MCRYKGGSWQNQPMNMVRNTPEEPRSLATSSMDDQTYEYNMSCYMSPVSSSSKPHPIQVFLSIDGQPVNMEVDTGASVSIISEEEHQRRWPGVPVQHSTIKLHTYSGEPLCIVGETTVDAVYGQQQARLPLVIVAGRRPCLMGRDWLQHLEVRLAENLYPSCFPIAGGTSSAG